MFSDSRNQVFAVEICFMLPRSQMVKNNNQIIKMNYQIFKIIIVWICPRLWSIGSNAFSDIHFFYTEKPICLAQNIHAVKNYI